MRVLTITKRRTSGKDLLVDRFGRYYHLPMEIGRLASDSLVIAADYEDSQRSVMSEEACRFITVPLNLPRFPAFLRSVTTEAREFGPDLVFAGGDTHLGWIGLRVARKLGVPFAFDVFDNYDAFESARLPGMKRLFRSTAAAADLTVVVSEGLADLLDSSGKVSVVPNGVDLDLFRPSPTRLEGEGTTITYVGGLAEDRGISTLIDAVRLVRGSVPSVRLYLAGPIHGGFKIPPADWISYLGFIEQAAIPELLWASDVAVLPYPATEWASFTSAYKLREYLACEVPVVVTDISTYAAELGVSEAICRPADPADMARALEFQLKNRVVEKRDMSWSWTARAASLYGEFEQLTSSEPTCD